MSTIRLWWCLLFVPVAFMLGIGGEALAADKIAPKPDMGPAVIFPDLPASGPVRNDVDAYGGWLGLTGKATGFFHIEQLGGRWWLVTPEGHAFFMLQIGWTKKEDSTRLRSWGFNASEADTDMPYAVDVRFFRAAKKQLPVAHRPGYPPWVSADGRQGLTACICEV